MRFCGVIIFAFCSISLFSQKSTFSDRLANGLTIVYSIDTTVQDIAVELWLRAGSAYEKGSEYGLAHFFEHAALSGKSFTSNSVNNALSYWLNIDGNAGTKADYIRYYSKFPKEAFRIPLASLASRLASLPGDVTDSMLLPHKKIVRSEMGFQYGKAWDAELTDIIRSHFFGTVSGYGHSAYGDIRNIDLVTAADIQKWQNTFCVARNAMLIVTGNFFVDSVRNAVAGYFGSLPGGIAHTIQKPVLLIQPEKFIQLSRNIPEPKLYLTFPIGAWGDAETDQKVLLSDMLGSGRSSLLYKELTARNFKINDIRTFLNSFQYAGYVTIEISLAPGADPQVVYQAASGYLDKLKAGSWINQQKLNGYRQRMIKDIYHQLEVSQMQGSRSELVGEGMLFRNNPAFYENRLGNINKITEENLSSALTGFTKTLLAVSVAPERQKTISPSDSIPVPIIASRSLPLPGRVMAQGSTEVFFFLKRVPLATTSFNFSCSNNGAEREWIRKSWTDSDLSMMELEDISSDDHIALMVTSLCENTIKILNRFQEILKKLPGKNKLSNFSIILSGGYDSAAVLRNIAEQGLKFPRTKPAVRSADARIQPGSDIALKPGSSPQIEQSVLISYTGDRQAGNLFLSALAPLLNKRLNNILREKKQLTYGVSVSEVFETTRKIKISFSAESGKSVEAFTILKEELHNIGSPTGSDLSTFRKMLRNMVSENIATTEDINRMAIGLLKKQMSVSDLNDLFKSAGILTLAEFKHIIEEGISETYFQYTITGNTEQIPPGSWML
jgi:predicted Zn-dependent peptidase